MTFCLPPWEKRVLMCIYYKTKSKLIWGKKKNHACQTMRNDSIATSPN